MEPILDVRDLKAHFFTRRGVVKAVNGMSFRLHAGETLGIVGESGSGKSVSQMSLLRLLPSPPLKIVGGEAFFRGKDLLRASDAELRAIRGDRISVIFQEPMTSLNPYLRIGAQVVEPLLVHRKMTRAEAWHEAEAALDRVGIPATRNALDAYPHEFSGGMRQRVMIAMALTTRPEVLIADEPTTALDVTVQAQILALLKDIQRETGMAIVLITHDLGVVAGLADRVLVMYGGRVFEEGSAEQVFYASRHPYTMGLLRSTPRLDVDTEVLPSIAGVPPDLARVGEGCPFFERCPVRLPQCSLFPAAREFGSGHVGYCHWKGEGSPWEVPARFVSKG